MTHCAPLSPTCVDGSAQARTGFRRFEGAPVPGYFLGAHDVTDDVTTADVTDDVTTDDVTDDVTKNIG